MSGPAERNVGPAGEYYSVMDRRAFLQRMGLVAGGIAAGPALNRASALLAQSPLSKTGAFEFVFARLRYDSGDWDYNPKVCVQRARCGRPVHRDSRVARTKS